MSSREKKDHQRRGHPVRDVHPWLRQLRGAAEALPAEVPRGHEGREADGVRADGAGRRRDDGAAAAGARHHRGGRAPHLQQRTADSVLMCQNTVHSLCAPLLQ